MKYLKIIKTTEDNFVDINKLNEELTISFISKLSVIIKDYNDNDFVISGILNNFKINKLLIDDYINYEVFKKQTLNKKEKILDDIYRIITFEQLKEVDKIEIEIRNKIKKVDKIEIEIRNKIKKDSKNILMEFFK